MKFATVPIVVLALLLLGSDRWSAVADPQKPALDDMDSASWPPDRLNNSALPVDLSFLNFNERPAGKHGFLKIDGENLSFEDGTEVRFWGTNLTAKALFGAASHEDVKVQARRLSKLGFNLVRIHHHDASWVDPNIFGSSSSQSTENLDAAMLERLDWIIKCLKDEGIYIWLDLYDSRQLRSGDHIDAFEEIAHGPVGELKGYNYVNASIEQAMRRFAEQYLTHLNTFTGLRYVDDPAIVAVLVANETDITHHFGQLLLPGKNAPWHASLFMAEAEKFASKYGIPKDKVWRSWLPGPSKLFLNELEHRFNERMENHLRALGVKVPIIPSSQWGGNPLSSLPALTSGSIIDTHAYGGAAELQKNPIYESNLIPGIAVAQVVGFPVTVTEWNVSPFPVADRHTIPLYLASVAGFQGWSALMQYAYTQQPLGSRGFAGNWEAINDPSLISMLPAAALLYRRGDVRKATTSYVYAPTAEMFYGLSTTPSNSIALRTATEIGHLAIAIPKTHELPWLVSSNIPAGAVVFTDPNVSFLAKDATQSVSDTSELRRDWQQGTFTIDTPRTQAAMGFTGGKHIRLGDVDFLPETQNSTIAVQSLDGDPIASSSAILISLGARSETRAGKALPFFSEPVTGRILIRAKVGLTLYKLQADKEQQITTIYDHGTYQISLEDVSATHWLKLRAPDLRNK